MLADLWQIQKMAIGPATAKYNSLQNDAVRITIEETVEGWDTKALAMVRSGTPRWNGTVWSSAWAVGYQWIKTGLVQPIDSYVKASNIPWASKLRDLYIAPNIYEYSLFEGKQYFIPVFAYTSVVGYRTDMLQEVGYDTVPATWDEFTQMMHKIKAKFSGDQVVPLAYVPTWWRTPGPVHATFHEKPYDEQGVSQILSPEWFDAVDMMRGWFKDGLTSLDVAANPSQYWERGKSALMISSHSVVKQAQNIWGREKVYGANMPMPGKGMNSRTWSIVDGAFLFDKAEYPQEAVDFMLTMYGPEGEVADIWWKGMVNYEGAPHIQSTIDRLLPADTPQHTKWVRDSYDMIPHSTFAPMNGTHFILNTKITPWLERVYRGDAEIKPAMENAKKEIDDEIAKMKSSVDQQAR
jgi:ABC-type glycerol-3-phosphate transport system substrate-binding protein